MIDVVKFVVAAIVNNPHIGMTAISVGGLAIAGFAIYAMLEIVKILGKRT